LPALYLNLFISSDTPSTTPLSSSSLSFLIIHVHVGTRLILKNWNIGKALKIAFLEFDWILERFSIKGKKSSQEWYF